MGWLLLAIGVCGSGVGVQGQGITLSSHPTLSIGGLTEDPRYILSEVVGGLRLPDGRVVVADRFNNSLRMYGRDGRYVREVGGEGQGPGEYEYVRGLGRCAGEAVVAFDLHWDMKVYDQDLELLEERGAELPGLGGTAYAFDCAPSGQWVATGWGDTGKQFRHGFFVATAPVVIGRDSELLANLGERLSSERVGTLGPDGAPAGSGPHPFGKATRVAIGMDKVYVGDGSAYRVEVYNAEGRPLTPIEWSGPDRRIRSGDVEAWAEQRLRGRSPNQARALRQWLRDLPPLQDFPAYDELRVDTAGRLWVRYFPRPGSSDATWTVFEEGGQRGQLVLPVSSTILDIGTDYILVVDRDDLDVPTVREYGLTVS